MHAKGEWRETPSPAACCYQAAFLWHLRHGVSQKLLVHSPLCLNGRMQLDAHVLQFRDVGALQNCSLEEF